MTALQKQSTTGYIAPTNRKIYLSRVTAYLDVSDATGHLDSPDPLVDKADVNPGFLVTSPSSYTQVFVLPSLPDEARNSRSTSVTRCSSCSRSPAP